MDMYLFKQRNAYQNKATYKKTNTALHDRSINLQTRQYSSVQQSAIRLTNVRKNFLHSRNVTTPRTNRFQFPSISGKRPTFPTGAGTLSGVLVVTQCHVTQHTINRCAITTIIANIIIIICGPLTLQALTVKPKK